MAYEFSLDGKSLWALIGGSAALCLLIFFAGALLGANWDSRDVAATPTRGTTAATTANAAAATQPANAPLNADMNGAVAAASVPALPYAAPQGPVVYNLPERQGYAAQVYAPQSVGAQGYAAQGYAARAPESSDYAAQQRYAAAAAPAVSAREVAAAPPVNLNREAARLNSTGVDSDPKLVSEADAFEAASASSASYSVQVGAYTEEGEARRLVGDLENKGYTPALFSGRDAEGRSWYAVRIGAYANQREAAQAANNFSRQEKSKAIVRPFNSL
jgi:cell division septation protein DedD